MILTHHLDRLAMWCSNIDQYITLLPTSSSSVLPLMLTLPGHPPTCQIGLYLPTAGLENQFMAALSELGTTISSVLERFVEDTIVFIRGDMNISKRNSSRTPLLAHVMSKHKLRRTLTFHPSYHHFMGIGSEFDSDLDVLL